MQINDRKICNLLADALLRRAFSGPAYSGPVDYFQVPCLDVMRSAAAAGSQGALKYCMDRKMWDEIPKFESAGPENEGHFEERNARNVSGQVS